MTDPNPTALPSRVRFADFELDAAEHQLRQSGQLVHLQPKSFLLLETLVRRPGHLFTKEELFDRIWSGQVVTDGVLTRCIKEVRKALEDDAQHPRFIETVPRVGYRFVYVIAAPAPAVDNKRLIFAGLVLVAAMAALLSFFWPTHNGPAESPKPEPAAERIDITALNADRFEQQGWVNMSLRGKRLVVARESFEKALAIDPRHAGAKSGLAITLLLGGRSKRDDPVFRQRVNTLITQALEIDPNLAAAHTARGFQYFLEPSQEAQAMAEASLRKALTLDPKSIEPMNWLSTMLLSQGRLNEAIALKRKALKIYPSHSTLTGNLAQSLAYAGRYEEARLLMDSHRQIPGGAGPMDYPRSVLARIIGHLDEAAQIQATAITANPESFFYVIALVKTLATLGRFEQAWALHERARLQCAGDSFLQDASNFIHLQAGEFTKLRESASEYVGDIGDRSAETARLYRSSVGVAAILTHDYAGGISQLHTLYPNLESVRGLRGSFDYTTGLVHYLAYAYQQSRQAELARPYLEKVATEIAFRWDHGYSGYSALSAGEAQNQTLLGNRATALTILERAVAEGWRDYNNLVHDPRWDLLRSAPRFDRLLDQLANSLAVTNASIEVSDWIASIQQLPPPNQSLCKKQE